MKKYFLLLFAVCQFTITHAQDLPCCDIISIDPSRNTVTFKSTNTARVAQFRAEPEVIATLRMGDRLSLNAAMNRVIGIGNVARNYPVMEVTPGDPCCAVSNITPDPAAPCCDIVTAKHQTTAATVRFQVPKEMARQLPLGHPVFVGQLNDYAMVQTSAPGTTVRPLYGYRITSGDLSRVGYPVSANNHVNNNPSSGNNNVMLEERLLQLEKRIERLELMVQHSRGTDTTAVAPKPSVAYETVNVELFMRSNEFVTILVNNNQVATYNSPSTLTLDRYLRSGQSNRVVFQFSPGAKESTIYVRGKFSVNGDWALIHSFQPTSEKGEAIIDVTFR